MVHEELVISTELVSTGLSWLCRLTCLEGRSTDAWNTATWAMTSLRFPPFWKTFPNLGPYALLSKAYANSIG